MEIDLSNIKKLEIVNKFLRMQLMNFIQFAEDVNNDEFI